MPATAAVTASIAVLSQPLKDLYESGKSVFKDQLSKWNNSRNIKALATRLSAYEQVKTIWQREKKVRLSSFYFPSKVIFQTGVRKTVNSLRDLPMSGGIVIQGTVGQGKTVFLRHLCVQELSAQASGRIPVFFELRKLDATLTLEQAIFNTLESLGFEANSHLFDYYAKSGKLVVLLDAFDELDEGRTNHVVTTLELWAVQYPQLQFIVTCRPGGEIQKSSHFSVIPLAPLAPDDHKAFLTKIGVKGETLIHLLRAIEGSPVQIRDLLTTPLLLTLLVLVYQSEGVVPNELPEFFKLLFSTVFSRHDRSKPAFVRKHKSGLNERKLENLFEAFCFAVLRRRYTVNLKSEQLDQAFADALRFSKEQTTVEGFRHDVVKVACLLQEDGLFTSFVHKSLLDYYPAAFVKNCTDDQAQKLYASFGAHWDQWKYVLQFLSYIDEYRFAKYFAIPNLEMTLASIGVVNGDLSGPTIERVLDAMFPHFTFFEFAYDPLEKKFKQRRFGPYTGLDSFFTPTPQYLNLIRSHEFFVLPELNCEFKKKTVDSEEVFAVYWKDLLSSEQMDETRQRASELVETLVERLSRYRKLVADEIQKADVMAAFEVSS